jgi:ribosomal protein L16 Arg81 hydroxylase
LPDRSFTAGGGIGASIGDQVSDDAVLAAFAGGATLVLQGLHRTWQPVLAFSQQLAADLGHPNQVNAYVTPPQSTGFSDHYDVHDVFVLQVAGEKRWRIRRPVREAPLRSEPWTDHRSEVGQAARQPPLIEQTLRPGDCLYLPRGFIHSATALGATSIHLTVGVHPWHRTHLAEALLETALRSATEDPLVRRSLPAGTDVGDSDALGADIELVRAALHRALDEADAGELAGALHRRHRAAQRPAPLHPLAQALAADRLQPEAVLLLRDHLAATLERQAGQWVLRSRAGRLEVADDERETIDTLLATGRATAHDLGLDTARRLLRAGVVVPA